MDDMSFLYVYAILVFFFIVIVLCLKSWPVKFKMDASLLDMPPGCYRLKKTMFFEIVYMNMPLVELEDNENYVGQIIPQEGFWKKGISSGTPLFFVNRTDFETTNEIYYKYSPLSEKLEQISK